MPSTSETILQALYAILRTIPDAKVLRNEALTVEIPAGGLLILRDGDPGEPEVTFSPLLYHFEHVAELEIFVSADAADRPFDDLRVAVGQRLVIDRTLGGRLDWLETAAPAPVDLPFEGAAAIKAASIPIRLFYATHDPLI